ncbi:hypothetical protein Asera_43270 [Actinocatenispora sera]|uniref:Uncharacterized protein n=1 Tax=Actinocatenispora sera TaxID=390989 RepID=A0A810L599_9ACTN|nr:hypothetical protein Asera_43270 [Actinocatenispora sera]
MSVAARVPVNTGATAASRHRSTSRAATGMPGTTRPAAPAAHSRSQPTSTRRVGKRSAIDDSRVPPSAYGSSPSARLSALSSGDPVSRYTRTDRAISASTSPSMDRTWAANTARNSGTAKTER